MTTGGEGGMFVTNDESLWKRAWAIKDHGKSYDAVFNKSHPPGFRWLHESFGTNMRMTEMQAAIGRLQLRKLNDWNEKRTANALKIAQALASFAAVSVPLPDDQIRHGYYRLYAFVDNSQLADGWDRDRVMNEIVEQGIPCFSGSCPEIYDEKAFEDAGLRPAARMPNAQALGPRSLAFLVHPTLTGEDTDRVCAAVVNVLSQASL